MEIMWKRFMAVLALSLVLPQLTVWFGSKRYSAAVEMEPSQAAAETLPATQPEEPLAIGVQMADGQTTQMELEEYVRGVVLAEMPTSFGLEALKAQAIAARTYALRRITAGDKHGGAVCTDSSCCQAWISDGDYLAAMGEAEDVQKAAAAAEGTAGLVVTYGGTLAETTYFSCSGGRTESALAVWDAEIPYLQAVDSPGEEFAAVFSQELYFTPAQFAACLGRELTGSPEQWLGSVCRTEGNGVATMVIGGITYTGVELRKLLGLPSTWFVMMADEAGVSVTTWGHGHRVGMSQYGAGAMAEEGYDCAAILAHYYPGTEIDKIRDLGYNIG